MQSTIDSIESPAPVDWDCDVTIITATFQRPKDLWRLLESVQLQDLGPLQVEHLVVQDGPNDQKPMQSDRTEVVMREFPKHPQIFRRWLPQTTHWGQYGAGCKDVGIREARGRYVVFWDDDNWFYPHALRYQVESVASNNVLVGVAQVRHNVYNYQPVPDLDRWRKEARVLTLGNVDTGCLIVKSEIARLAHWYDQQGPASDFRYLQRLITQFGSHDRVHVSEQVIGVHL